MTTIYKDLGLNAIMQGLKSIGKAQIKTGLFNPKLAQIGFWQEFGFWNVKAGRWIEETPFLRSSLEGKPLSELKDHTAKSLKQFYIRPNPETFLKAIGEKHTFIIKYQIHQKIWKRNADSTIKQKGFDWRLVETSEIMDNITYKIQ